MKKKILLNSIFIYSIIITILYINTINNLKETDNKLKESKEKYLLEISNDTFIIGNGNTNGSNLLTLSYLKRNQHIAVTYSGVIDVSTNYDVIDKIDKVQLLEEL